MASDEQIIASIETATSDDSDSNRCVAFNFQLQKIYFATDDSGNLYQCDLDGSNVEFLTDDLDDFESGIITALLYHDGFIYAGMAGESLSKWELQTGILTSIATVGSDAILALGYDPSENELYYIADDSTGLRKVEAVSGGSGSAVVGSINCDAFCIDPANDRIYLWNVTENPDQLQIYDLSGSLIAGISFEATYSGFNVDHMQIDLDNGVIYMHRSDTDELWSIPAEDDMSAGDASLILAFSGTPAGQLALVTDATTEEFTSPGDISGMVLWLDAADALDAGAATPDNNEAVATWPDKSGNGNDVTVTGPIYKTSVANLNNLPGIEFDGSDDFMQLPDDTIGWPMTLFIVLEADSGANGYFAFFGENGVGQCLGLRDGSGDMDWLVNSGTTDGPPYTQVTGDVLQWMAYSYKTTNGIYLISNQGGEIDTFATPPDGEDMNPQVFGARADGELPSVSLPWEGIYLEVLAWNRTLTYLESSYLRNYANAKYGL